MLFVLVVFSALVGHILMLVVVLLVGCCMCVVGAFMFGCLSAGWVFVLSFSMCLWFVCLLVNVVIGTVDMKMMCGE